MIEMQWVADAKGQMQLQYRTRFFQVDAAGAFCGFSVDWSEWQNVQNDRGKLAMSFDSAESMREASLLSYLEIVLSLIKQEASKGNCSLRIPKNPSHIDILVSRLEEAGYVTSYSVDSTILQINWGLNN